MDFFISVSQLRRTANMAFMVTITMKRVCMQFLWQEDHNFLWPKLFLRLNQLICIIYFVSYCALSVRRMTAKRLA